MEHPYRHGRRRLGLLLCGTSGLACAAMMGTVLIAYGTPYNPLWWAVMAVILGAAAVAPLFLLSPIDWVIAGYRRDIDANAGNAGAKDGSADIADGGRAR